MKEIKTARNSVEEKKKKVQWKPAKLLDTISGLNEDEFVYRWVDKDAANMVKKQSEGWMIVNQLDGEKIVHNRPGILDDGSNLVPSLTDYRELILMKIPKELAQARREYYDNLTNQRLEGLVSTAKDNAKNLGGLIHGSIKDGTRIIE